jgi:hypothetical protein
MALPHCSCWRPSTCRGWPPCHWPGNDRPFASGSRSGSARDPAFVFNGIHRLQHRPSNSGPTWRRRALQKDLLEVQLGCWDIGAEQHLEELTNRTLTPDRMVERNVAPDLVVVSSALLLDR